MKRRDLLKAIGISGLLPFVKSEPAEAAPSPAPQVIEPKPFTMGSASIRGAQEYASGTVSYFTTVGNDAFRYDVPGIRHRITTDAGVVTYATEVADDGATWHTIRSLSVDTNGGDK